MISWLKRTVNCFNCGVKVKKKLAYRVEFKTAEGPLTISSCQLCSEEINEVLAEIERARQESHG